MLLLKLAWRNIWRNKRRTLITAASIMFAVFFALILRSLQIGSYAKMVDNVVGAYTGYIQIHKNGYWDDKVIDNHFIYTDSLSALLKSNNRIKTIVPRIESFALASSKDQTKTVSLIGIKPEQESELTGLKEKVVSGRYLQNHNEALVAQGLADFLKLDVNDTIVLISQGIRGMSAAGKYPVTGIVSFPNPEFNKSMVYLPLSATAEFFSMNDTSSVTTVALDLGEADDLKPVMHYLQNKLPTDQYEIMSWREMLVELVQQIEGDQAGGYIMLAILYIIIGFGMFGTILMMMAERTKEFGVMASIGMKKIKMAGMVAIEMFFIALIGILGGILISLPAIIYGNQNPIYLTGNAAEAMEEYGMEPIMPFALEGNIFLNQTMIVVILMVIAVIYPLISLLRLKETEALRR